MQEEWRRRGKEEVEKEAEEVGHGIGNDPACLSLSLRSLFHLLYIFSSGLLPCHASQNPTRVCRITWDTLLILIVYERNTNFYRGVRAWLSLSDITAMHLKTQSLLQRHYVCLSLCSFTLTLLSHCVPVLRFYPTTSCLACAQHHLAPQKAWTPSSFLNQNH